MPSLKERLLSGVGPCVIIAEAGVNHNGDVALAKQLIDAAREAGVDAVKFQTFRSDRVESPSARKAPYQVETTNPKESQLAMLRELELSPEAHSELQAHARRRGLTFLSTPYDEESSDLLDDLGVPVFKIASAECTNLPLLRHVARKGKPIILSTGMCFIGDVDEAVRAIRDAGNQDLVLLHCLSNYPADPEDVNLRAMKTLEVAFSLPVGYSDHAPGHILAVGAVAMGARVIEKHFTIDRSLPGPDHRASLEPEELRVLVRDIRLLESALGDGQKQPTPSELPNLLTMRRSIAAAVSIPADTVLASGMLTALRPGTGISPRFVAEVVGRRVRRSLASGQLLDWSDLW